MESRRGSVDNGKTVLIVDGDPKGALIAQALRRRGYQVASAESTDAAMKSVREIHPAAVVVVVEPPAASSFLPLVRQLSEENLTHEIPVVVVRCEDESLLTQAQRIGNVVVLFGDTAPETVANEVDRVLLESAAQVSLSFPVICPKCGEQAGVPRSVSTAANRGTYISLFCEKCAQQWRVFRQADAPGLAKA
jgi:CheY-like chemotaxis protein